MASFTCGNIRLDADTPACQALGRLAARSSGNVKQACMSLLFAAAQCEDAEDLDQLVPAILVALEGFRQQVVPNVAFTTLLRLLTQELQTDRDAHELCQHFIRALAAASAPK